MNIVLATWFRHCFFIYFYQHLHMISLINNLGFFASINIFTWVILIKSWLLVDNRWCLMLNYCSMIDFQHAYVFGLFIFGLDLDSCCWSCSSFALHVLEFTWFLSILDIIKIYYFCVFLQIWFVLSFDFGFGLFFGSNQCFWFGL
jgi:hypothetical protein